MAFIESMHRNKPDITYLLTYVAFTKQILGFHPANETRHYKVMNISHWLGASLESSLQSMH